MRTRTAFVLALAATVAAACDTRDDDTTFDTMPGEDIAPTQPAPAQPVDMIVSMAQFEPTAEAGAMQVQGTAELRRRSASFDSDLELHVRLAGLSENDHAWHIHEGACGSVGQIVMPISNAPGRDGIGSDLDPGSDGTVEETVNIDRQHMAMLSPNQSYSVNVHRGDSDNPGPAIACATLEIPSDAWGTGAAGTAPGTTPGY
jgi:hypothetical protein